jgi:hypothetical protein
MEEADDPLAPRRAVVTFQNTSSTHEWIISTSLGKRKSNADDDDDDGDGDVGRFFDYEKDEDDDVYVNGEYDKTDDLDSEVGREQLLLGNTNKNGLAVDGNGEEQQPQRVRPPQSTATTTTTTTPPPPRQQSDSRQTDPWFSMVDPETQEVFYWNQETEEMRWEVPAAWDHRNADPNDKHS